MAGMIASIARILRSGNATPAEIAKCIGISREQLTDRLALMERQGYLARHGNTDPGPDAECRCGHCCSSCCKRDDSMTPILYTLTDKGKQLSRDM
ncbi:MAG: helix-turn-helix domain-containing protein [Methanoregula sp.]|nr:helix-turn-helix domain-containing protein [Methanoregula sp.]